MKTIKFFWNGIKIDGKLYRCHYSDGKLINYPEGTLTIYRKDYGIMPDVPGLNVQNDSDLMTDYFERDRIRIKPDNKFYNEVKNALALHDEHYVKRHEKYIKQEEEVKERLHIAR